MILGLWDKPGIGPFLDGTSMFPELAALFMSLVLGETGPVAVLPGPLLGLGTSTLPGDPLSKFWTPPRTDGKDISNNEYQIMLNKF